MPLSCIGRQKLRFLRRTRPADGLPAFRKCRAPVVPSAAQRALAIPEVLEHIFVCSDATMLQYFGSWRLVNRFWKCAVDKVAVRDATIHAMRSGRLEHRTTALRLEPSALENAGGIAAFQRLEIAAMGQAWILERAAFVLGLCANLSHLSIYGQDLVACTRYLSEPLAHYVPLLRSLELRDLSFTSLPPQLFSGLRNVSHITIRNNLPSTSVPRTEWEGLDGFLAAFGDTLTGLKLADLRRTESQTAFDVAALVERALKPLRCLVDLRLSGLEAMDGLLSELPSSLQRLEIVGNPRVVGSVMRAVANGPCLDRLGAPPRLSLSEAYWNEDFDTISLDQVEFGLCAWENRRALLAPDHIRAAWHACIR